MSKSIHPWKVVRGGWLPINSLYLEECLTHNAQRPTTYQTLNIISLSIYFFLNLQSKYFLLMWKLRFKNLPNQGHAGGKW